MWGKIVESGSPQMTIWRMRIACWIPKAKNTHSNYVILNAFPQQQRLHDRASHAQKPEFVFRRNRRIHLNRRGRHFSRPMAAELCASEVVMLDTSRSEVVWRVLATHSIRQFPLHFPSCASPCANTLQLDSTSDRVILLLLHTENIQHFEQREMG